MPYHFDLVIDRRSTNSNKWRKYPPDVLPLWVADMDFQAPPAVLAALQSSLVHGVLGYESPTNRLREVVAERMQRLYGWQFQPDMVVPVPGVISSFNLAARVACQPGEGLLIQPPVYPPFLGVHKNIGLTHQVAPLTKIKDGSRLRFEIDFDHFEAAIDSGGTKTGMFLLCHPHNPTGQVYDRKTLTRLADICLRHGVLICSDEIHSELLLDGASHTPLASLAAEIAARSITLVSPSKTFNVAGLNCAFAIITDKTLHDRYCQEVERQTFHMNSLGLAAAQAAFSGECDDWLVELNLYLTANRDELVEQISSRLPGISVSVPQATYLAWLDCSDLVASGRIKTSPFQFFLEKARVALNDGALFGEGGQGCVRLNFGCPRSTMQSALERMQAALAES